MELYWELFRQTGAPIFYLLYRQRDLHEAQTAWGAEETAAEV